VANCIQNQPPLRKNGVKAEKWKSKSVIPPINLATTFKLDDTSFDLEKHFYYGRIGNPTRECLEESVAKLENGKHALAFSSGMGAITTVMESCLKVKFNKAVFRTIGTFVKLGLPSCTIILHQIFDFRPIIYQKIVF